MKKTKKMVVGGAILDKLTDGAIKAPLGIIPQLLYKQHKDSKAAEVASDMPQEAPVTARRGPRELPQMPQTPTRGMKKGGKVRGDGICQRGKTKGTMR